IERYLADGTFPEFEVSDNLKQPGAAFVTLTKNGQLRGCIGHIIAQDPLYETVSVCAVQAAVADRRFLPVQPDELPELHIEISVLTPLQEVKSLDEIEVGRDGLVISLGNNRGLLLPQVATEYGWNRTEFLEHTCRKAGLPTDAYKSPQALIQKFQAVIFHEK
ncbi:MAG: AmmeMemoRadiSam system protein A, partial [Candidatus Zixiibacteriota bacterium]